MGNASGPAAVRGKRVRATEGVIQACKRDKAVFTEIFYISKRAAKRDKLIEGGRIEEP
jgi:hypothetical protein